MPRVLLTCGGAALPETSLKSLSVECRIEICTDHEKGTGATMEAIDLYPDLAILALTLRQMDQVLVA